MVLFSSSGQSPGRAIVLPLALAAASALAKSLTLKFFYVMGKVLSGKLSCPCRRADSLRRCCDLLGEPGYYRQVHILGVYNKVMSDTLACTIFLQL